MLVLTSIDVTTMVKLHLTWRRTKASSIRRKRAGQTTKGRRGKQFASQIDVDVFGGYCTHSLKGRRI